ncbi:MAG: TolC family protein [Polyangiaceae bacterium]
MRGARMTSRRLALSLGAALPWVVASGGDAWAQDAPSQPVPAPAVEIPRPGRTVTLPEALSYAHDHQPGLLAALARVEARKAAAAIPTGQWLPSVGATAQIFAATANNTTATYVQVPFMDIPRIGATPAVSSGSWGPYASTLVGAGLTQQVFDFGRIAAERAAADGVVDVEKHRADQVRLDIDFGVEESFYAVFAAKEVVSASEQAYERSRVHRDFAKRGVDSGLRPPIELTRAEADLDRFDVGRIRARGGLAIAQSGLAAAIGAPDAAVDAAGNPPALAEMPALDEALRLALARDPRIVEALALLEAAEKQTRAAGAELRQDLSLTATVTGRAGGAPPSSGPTAGGDGWVPDVPNWNAGLVLSWPLFDGVLAARSNAARAEERIYHDEIDVAREAQLAAVRQAYVRIEAARSALVALQNGVVAARANYEQADARFRAGIATAVEVADAEAVRADADIQLAVGRFEVARTRAALGRLIAETL